MSIYKGTTLIAGALPNAANQDLSNLSQTGQAVIDGKAETDLSNVTDTGYIKMAGAGMPSNTYIDLTLGASGSSYTAPANGWVLCSLDLSANGWLAIKDFWAQASNIAGYVSIMCPLLSGENFGVDYNGYLHTIFFRFYYAVGSESEAS